MPKYLPLDIPPGFSDHGTLSDSRGLWRDGSLVRWEKGSMRAVGGWRKVETTSGVPVELTAIPGAGIARKAHGWLDNNSAPFLAVGTDDALYAFPTSLVVEDITPTGFAAAVDGENLGYGGKAYGASTYGTERQSNATPSLRSVWSMDNWGEQWIGCATGDQNIYIWDLATATAEILTDSPSASSVMVTAERFVFAFQADNNPRKVMWCDRENYTDWTPTALNQAGDYDLVTEGSIQGGCRVRGRTLIVTTYDAHVATYLGPPTVYGFDRIGRGCGLAAPLTLVTAAQGAFWMGARGFYHYDGSQVVEVPCTVLDHVFSDINRDQIRKAWGVANERNGEVWWFYPSAGAVECDSYVAYDYEESHWLVGMLDRSAGLDTGPYTLPVWIDWNDGQLYYHESGANHDGTQPYVESGPIYLGDGDQIMHVTQMIQDEIIQGQVSAYFTTNFWPDNDVQYEHGPYEMGNPTDIRISGRQMRMKLVADDAASWRISGIRLGVTEGGKR